MSKSLFQISQEFLILLDSAEEEITPELDALIASLESDEAVKLDSYLHVIKTLDMQADTAEKESALYSARAKADRSRRDQLKDRLRQHLETTGRTEVRTATGRPIKLVGHGGSQAVVLSATANLDEFADKYVVTKITKSANREAIREAIEAGEFPAEWATLAPRGKSLKIG